jgi:hypothetical protein
VAFVLLCLRLVRVVTKGGVSCFLKAEKHCVAHIYRHALVDTQVNRES